ncbi:MAG: DUF481 domain-containing protein [Chitinophagales bacterium]
MNFDKSYLILLLIFVGLIPIKSNAQQIVHVENKRLKADESGWSGDVSIQVNFIQNINDIFQTANNASFQYTFEKNTLLSLSNYNLTIFNQSKVVNEGFQHFRYNRTVTDVFSWEAFGQAQFNEIIKIQFRSLLGTGPRIRIFENDSSKTRMYFGPLYMYEYEEETTGIINRVHRMSAYVSLGIPIHKRFFIDMIAYYQPNIVDWKNYRSSIQASLEISIIKKLILEIRLGLLYNSRPPEEIRNTFYNFSNGLKFRF